MVPKHLYVGALWLAFLIRGIFYVSAIPAWEGFDEYSHFAYVQHLAEFRRLPEKHDSIPREIAHSLQLLPAPRLLTHLPFPLTVHDDYWALPAEERLRRQTLHSELAPDLAKFAALPPYHIYEAQQPPLYYFWGALAYPDARTWPIKSRLWLLRFLNVLIASVVVPCTFAIARRSLGTTAAGMSAAAVVVVMPQLYFYVCRVSNDALAVALGSAVILLCLRALERPSSRAIAPVGVALGLCLLTKAYFLALVAPVGLTVALAGRSSRGAMLLRGLTAMGIAAAMGGWWYIRNYVTSGRLTGEQTERIVFDLSVQRLIGGVMDVPWGRAIDFVNLSYLWLGNWSFLVLRSWMYKVFLVFVVVAAAGAIYRFLRGEPRGRRREVLLLGSFILALFAGLAITRS